LSGRVVGLTRPASVRQFRPDTAPVNLSTCQRVTGDERERRPGAESGASSVQIGCEIPARDRIRSGSAVARWLTITLTYKPMESPSGMNSVMFVLITLWRQGHVAYAVAPSQSSSH
jgi:hypothetical protein